MEAYKQLKRCTEGTLEYKTAKEKLEQVKKDATLDGKTYKAHHMHEYMVMQLEACLVAGAKRKLLNQPHQKAHQAKRASQNNSKEACGVLN